MHKLQEEHITEIIDDTSSDLYNKYVAGAEEHQGLLTEMPVLKLAGNTWEEILDFINYFHTLRKKLKVYFDDPLIKHRVAELDRLEDLKERRV